MVEPSAKKLCYSWTEYIMDMEFLKMFSQKSKIDHIVSIYRGSLVPAVQLSNSLNIPMSIIDFQTRDGSTKEPKLIKDAGLDEAKNILILDDIYDTGKTMKIVRSFVNKNIAPDSRIFEFVFFGSDKTPDNITTCRSNEGKWVVFPWEK